MINIQVIYLKPNSSEYNYNKIREVLYKHYGEICDYDEVVLLKFPPHCYVYFNKEFQLTAYIIDDEVESNRFLNSVISVIKSVFPSFEFFDKQVEYNIR